MERAKRIEYIDALRGFAMILVVYFHIPSYCLGNAYIGFNDVLEWVRMPLFFFISGFVFYKADWNWDSDTIKIILKKKFMVQIIPMTVFMTLFLILFDYWELRSLGSDKKGYWYTFVLFEYFVLYIGAEAVFNKAKTTKGEIMVFISVLLISLSAFYYAKYYTSHSHELGIWKDVLGLLSFVKLRHFIFFWFGTFVKRHFSIFISLSDNVVFLTTIAIIYLIMTIFPTIYHINGIEYPAFAITGFIISTLVFTLFRKNEHLFTKDKWLGKSLQYVGRRTLDIYLIHYFFLPYHCLQDFGAQLIGYNRKTLEVIVILPLALSIIAISLTISSIIRINPLFAKYLFGAKERHITNHQ